MSTKKGCQFCIRYGLPLLPLRSAIVAQEEPLPTLPAGFTVPVEAKGEMAWTARLLREGFLYIWMELSKQWINYFVTREGYYHPISANDVAPHDIINQKIKPCIDQPAELANASLVTLPLKPAGMKNGQFWFAWSAVEWTDAVRKKHEEAAYRHQYMQCFDMDEWLAYGQTAQALPISQLTQTVAEYSEEASKSSVKIWSAIPWQERHPQEGVNLLLAAEQLCAGKGAMIVLQDPPAVAQDIAWLANYRINRNFYDNPDYSRELALSTAISALKENICARYEEEIAWQHQISELNTKLGYYTPYGMFTPGSTPLSDVLHQHHIGVLAQRVREKWQNEYGKFYDQSKQAAFIERFNQALKEYDKRIIVPMMEMYLTCLESEIMLNYFHHNFDTQDADSGILYLQSLIDCIDGCQDKLLIADYFKQRLAGSCCDHTNLFARAAVFNNDSFAEKITLSTHVSLDINALPWDKPADGFKDIFDQKIAGAQLMLEKYQNALSGALYSLIEKTINSKPVDALVSFAVVANKRVKIITLAAERKYFVSATVEELAHTFNITDRSARDRLRHYVDIQIRHIEANKMAMSGVQSGKFALLVDLNVVDELKAAAGSGQTPAPAIAKTLRSAEEVKNTIFPNTFKTKLAQLKGNPPSLISTSALKTLPFSGCVLSGAFQIYALIHAGLPKEFNVEATSRFSANILMAVGSVADTIERLLCDFKCIRWNAQIRIIMGSYFQRMMMGSLRLFKWLGGAAGIVGATFDAINAFTSFKNEHYDIAIAYGCSTFGGGILAVAVICKIVLSPIWILTAITLMFGAAIYLALNIKNDIQRWLLSCLWRQIPEGESAPLPAIWPTSQMEMAAFHQAIQQGNEEL